MIVLMRHAKVTLDSGQCIGRTPIPLSGVGVRQAEDLVTSLRDAGLKRLCSSPSDRAMKTIEPLSQATNMPVEIMADLDEINMGTWDGLSFDEIRAKYPDEYVERGKRFDIFRPPHGESFNDVAERAIAALTLISFGPRPVLVMTHIGLIRAVQCRLAGYSMDKLFNFSPANTECTLLTSVQGQLQLVETDVHPSRVLMALKAEAIS